MNKTKQDSINPDRFREALLFIDVTINEAAKIFNVSSATIQNWKNGKTPIPVYVELFLEQVGINRSFLLNKSKVLIAGSSKEIKMLKEYADYKKKLRKSFLRN